MRRWDKSYAETDELYREWMKQMPIIPFDPEWSVKITPPFAGAAVRFQVTKGDAFVSIYADFDNSLGFYADETGKPKPYWEVYPYDEDVARCDLGDVDTLCEYINHSLNKQQE